MQVAVLLAWVDKHVARILPTHYFHVVFASGLVFFGEDSGALTAVDASSGTPLWHFQANTFWKASPMTYMFDGKQHIAVASGPNIISFALVE